jgi:DNA-binding transcriptional MerR regulator
MDKVALPPIPAKRYFAIGEVAELCVVKPHVLRYWEQEFPQLRPMKRRGNRRYYQHHEVLMIRRIRELLYDQGFTISGARNHLGQHSVVPVPMQDIGATDWAMASLDTVDTPSADWLRNELLAIQQLLNTSTKL